MNGNKLLIDTNIALYLFAGNEQIAELLDEKEVYVSFITELELLGYKGISKKEQMIVRNFLAACMTIDINEAIKKSTIHIKQTYRMKLPDAIIAATAYHLDIPLLTANKGFQHISTIKLNLFEL